MPGAPSLRWVSTGRTWRVKGRICSRIGVVVCLKNSSLALNAGTDAWAWGIRPSRAGRAASEKRFDAVERRVQRGQRRGELAQRFLQRLLLVGEVSERVLGGGDEAFELAVVAAEFFRQQAEVVDHMGERDAAPGDRPVELGDVVGEGLQAPEGVAEPAAAAADSLRAAGDEQLDVALRVGVELGEEGFELDARFGLREREAVPGFDVLAAAARRDLDRHVVEVGFRPQQQRRVGMDQVEVLGLDMHADDGVTIKRSGTGIKSIAKIPVIAGGSGSALDFNFKLGKTYTYKGKKVGYFEARCPDGKFKVSAPKVLFKNEAKVAGVAAQTILKGGLAVPCTPKG